MARQPSSQTAHSGSPRRLVAPALRHPPSVGGRTRAAVSIRATGAGHRRGKRPPFTRAEVLPVADASFGRRSAAPLGTTALGPLAHLPSWTVSVRGAHGRCRHGARRPGPLAVGAPRRLRTLRDGRGFGFVAEAVAAVHERTSRTRGARLEGHAVASAEVLLPAGTPRSDPRPPLARPVGAAALGPDTNSSPAAVVAALADRAAGHGFGLVVERFAERFARTHALVRPTGTVGGRVEREVVAAAIRDGLLAALSRLAAGPVRPATGGAAAVLPIRALLGRTALRSVRRAVVLERHRRRARVGGPLVRRRASSGKLGRFGARRGTRARSQQECREDPRARPHGATIPERRGRVASSCARASAARAPHGKQTLRIPCALRGCGAAVAETRTEPPRSSGTSPSEVGA